MSVLKVGIPKGSLEKSTIDLFRRSGWNIQGSSRSYFPSIDDPELRCVMVRAQEMSRFIEMGTLDVGLTGKDWIIENNSDVVVVADLVYSKATQRPARWVLVVAENSPVQTARDLAGRKVFTELVRFTRRHFEEQNIDVDVEFSWGATEAKVVEGLADAIVEVTETGSTIRANGLRIVEELMVTYPQLIANKVAWEDPWKRERIEKIAGLLKGALNAEIMVGLKMNVPREQLAGVMNVLPSITAPTVADLYDRQWVSVETIISKNEVRELIPVLIKKGAVGIIEYPLNKII